MLNFFFSTIKDVCMYDNENGIRYLLAETLKSFCSTLLIFFASVEDIYIYIYMVKT